jgi:hypothetical protein
VTPTEALDGTVPRELEVLERVREIPAGFGVMRKSERDFGGDGWHDSLLMEVIAAEL